MLKKGVLIFPDFAVQGVTFENRQAIIAELSENTPLELSPEPSNPYDPNAVAILFEGKKIGYVPREYAGYISKLLKQGEKLYIVVIKIWEKLTSSGLIRIPIVIIYQLVEQESPKGRSKRVRKKHTLR